jgi:hypothetical protein
MHPARATDPRAGAHDAIAARRSACEDSALEQLPDDLLGVLRFVLTHRDVPPAILAADAADALALIRWLRAEADRLEHGAIGLARDAGVTWSLIGRHLGLGTGKPQATEQRYLRLTAKLAGQPPDPSLARHARRRQQAEERRMQRQDRWLAGHTFEIEAAARAIVALTLPSPTAQASADELILELRKTRPSHLQLMVWLRTALTELGLEGQLDAVPDPVRVAVTQLTSGWDRATAGRLARSRPARAMAGTGADRWSMTGA